MNTLLLAGACIAMILWVLWTISRDSVRPEQLKPGDILIDGVPVSQRKCGWGWCAGAVVDDDVFCKRHTPIVDPGEDDWYRTSGEWINDCPRCGRGHWSKDVLCSEDDLVIRGGAQVGKSWSRRHPDPDDYTVISEE